MSYRFGTFEFDTEEEYNNALDDFARIKEIKDKCDLDDPDTVKKLLFLIKNKKIIFKTKVGAAFVKVLITKFEEQNGVSITETGNKKPETTSSIPDDSPRAVHELETKQPVKATKQKKSSINKIILLCFIGFALLAGAKEAFFGKSTESDSSTYTVESAEKKEESVKEEKSEKVDKTDKTVKKRSSFHFSAGFVVGTFIVLLVLAYLYLNYYKKEYEAIAGTNCGGLLDYRWSIAQGVALLIAIIAKPNQGEKIGGIIFFLLCVAIVAFSEYAIYTDVMNNTGNKRLAKKAMIAQLSAAFLIGCVVAVILLIISAIMNKINEDEKKMSEKDKNFLKTALYSMAVFSMMEELESKVKN